MESHSKVATTWAALTLTGLGYTLHATDAGWDVEHPDGAWSACNTWQELTKFAKSAAEWSRMAARAARQRICAPKK
jgi:hypothetical protein